MYAGVLLVTCATIGFLAINMDNSRLLATSNQTSDAVNSAETLLQYNTAVLSTGLLKNVSFANYTYLTSQIRGAISLAINQNAPRIETHILSDRVVYNNGDLVFINVLVNDAFTKNPLNVNLNSSDYMNY